MTNMDTLIQKRMQKGEQTSKMSAMAEKSANGQLSSFAGVFSITPLSELEKKNLENILKEYASDGREIQKDLQTLFTLTSEVKAINNQAALLHGERIKKAHVLLTSYREGAFTAWLIAAYGNRQTPYNLMQYYEFYTALPSLLRPRAESMPRQAIYTLATRKGSMEKKKKIVENFQGETKAELLVLIREAFPLEDSDQRKENEAEKLIDSLRKLYDTLHRKPIKLASTQKKIVIDLLEAITRRVG